MKHIHKILAARQMSLFRKPQEKGSREWQTFNAVREDTVGAYRVQTPPVAHELRYPNTVHIRRYQRPRHLVTHPLILKQAR